METLLNHLNIYLIPIVSVGVLFLSVKSQLRSFAGRKYFRAVLLCVILGTALEIISWAPGDTDFGLFCVWMGSIAYLLFAALACYIWVLYVICFVKQSEDLRPFLRPLVLAALPLVVFLVLLITPFWHDLIFHVDATGTFIRGPLMWLVYLIAAGYLLASTLIAWSAARHELLKDRRREYRNLMLFLVLPISGLVVQSFFYEYPATIPCTALALLIIYFNMLRGYSALDALTGLNNRRQFLRYLTARLASPGRGGWGLVLIDLDGFKEINDVLGHTVGDSALIETAQLLRVTLQEHNAFVARYGGDEFTAVVPCKDEAALMAMLDAFASRVESFNARPEIPFRLQYSLGYALYASDTDTADSMLRLADAHMYTEKSLHKVRAMSPVKEGKSA